MPYELVEFPFSAGLDEGTDPWRTNKFLQLTNYVWSKRGRIEKRFGYTALSSAIIGIATSFIQSVTVTNGGSGYPTGAGAVTVTTTGGGGAGFVATATVNVSGVVTAVTTILNAGYGYTSAPTLVFTATSGSGAAATANLSTPAGAGGTLSNTFTIRANQQGTLQTTDGSRVYRNAPEGWIPMGTLNQISVKTTPVPLVGISAAGVAGTQEVQAFDWDMTYCNGYLIYGYSVQNTVYMAIMDASTGAVVVPPTASSAPSGNAVTLRPRVVTDGSRFVWVFFGGTAASPPISVFTADVTTTPPTVGANAINLQAPAGGNSYDWFDAQWDPVAGATLFAYVIQGTANITVEHRNYDNSGLYGFWTVTGSSHTLGIVNAAMKCLAVQAPPSGNTWVAYGQTPFTGSTTIVNVALINNSGTFVSTVYNVGTAVTNALTNVSVVETNAATSEAHVAVTSTDITTSTAIDELRTFRIKPVTNTLVNGTVTKGLTLFSRMWSPSIGSAHAVTYSLPAQTWFVSDLSGTDPTLTKTQAVQLALVSPRVGFGAAASLTSDLRSSSTLVSSYFNAFGNRLVPIAMAPEPAVSQILSLQQLSINYTAPLTAPVQASTSMVYPAGIPSLVGQDTVVELDFMSPPTITNVTISGATGSLSAGSYTWVALYERVTDDGGVIQSPPSAPFTATVAASPSQATVVVTTYSLGKVNAFSKSGVGVFIVLYRTLANGTTLYRVAADPFNPNDTYSFSAGNVPSVATASILDGRADTLVASEPQIYTSGNVFSNVCPPSTTIASRVRDRVYMAGTPDGAAIYYSDSIQSVGGVKFHDEQTIVIDDGGPVTAVAQLDASVLIFKARSIFIVFGTEGGPNGTGNTLSTPQLIPTGGIGCLSNSSVIVVPQGVMFQSSRGIELMQRDQSVTFVGEPVKDETKGQTVTAAVLATNQYQVRFYLSSGAVVVYSTLAGEWSTFAYSAPLATQDASSVLGVPTWCANGSIYQESIGLYSDGGAVIVSTAKSNWITLGNLEGYRRMRVFQLLGTYLDAISNVTISFAANFATSSFQFASFTGAQLLALPGFDTNRVQLEVWPSQQKVEAMAVTIVETPAGSGTAGIALDGFAFEVQKKDGRFKNVPAGAKS